MNNWPDELMAECYRQRILEEVEQIRLERLALKTHLYHPSIFGRTMLNFGNWMISTGKQLRERYEVHDINYNNAPVGDAWCTQIN